MELNFVDGLFIGAAGGVWLAVCVYRFAMWNATRRIR